MKKVTLTIREFAAVKRVAMNVNSLVVKKNKIAAKINELNAEFNALMDEIEGHEYGVKKKTNGLTSEDLIMRKVEETGKVDKDGKPIKITKWEPREGIVTYNEETKVYEIDVTKMEPIVSDCTESMVNSVDDTETAPEVENSNYDPTENY